MLIGAAAVLAILVALLAIPLTVRFAISWHGALQHDVRVEWAFGLVRARIWAPHARDEVRRDKASTARRSRPRRWRRRRTNVLGVLRLRSFRRRVLRFGRALWRALRKDEVMLRIRVGLGDPAETGRLWAWLAMPAALLSIVREISVRLEPEFVDATFELDTSGSVTVVPGRVVIIVAALLVSPSFWRGMTMLRQAR